VNNVERPRGSYAENVSAVRIAARRSETAAGHAIELTAHVDQARIGERSVGTAREIVEHFFRAGGTDAEDRAASNDATSTGAGRSIPGSAELLGAVEVAVIVDQAPG